MNNYKILFSISIFAIFLFCTSVIKNQTRIIEKKINKYNYNIAILKNDLYETQLDFFYLTSPESLSEKIIQISDVDYVPIEYSRIYSSFQQFLSEHQKTTKTFANEKKIKNKNKININQQSFFFEDYTETKK